MLQRYSIDKESISRRTPGKQTSGTHQGRLRGRAFYLREVRHQRRSPAAKLPKVARNKGHRWQAAQSGLAYTYSATLRKLLRSRAPTWQFSRRAILGEMSSDPFCKGSKRLIVPLVGRFEFDSFRRMCGDPPLGMTGEYSATASSRNSTYFPSLLRGTAYRFGPEFCLYE